MNCRIWGILTNAASYLCADVRLAGRRRLPAAAGSRWRSGRVDDRQRPIEQQARRDACKGVTHLHMALCCIAKSQGTMVVPEGGQLGHLGPQRHLHAVTLLHGMDAWHFN